MSLERFVQTRLRKFLAKELFVYAVKVHPQTVKKLAYEIVIALEKEKKDNA